MRPAAILVVLAFLALLAPGAASAQSRHVMMEQYAYSPATLTVRVGDTVTWTNHDQAPHDVVTTSAPAAFRSPLLDNGQTWSHTFTVAGTYAYYCSVHPDMRARVIVEPAETPEQPPPPPEPEQPPAPRPADPPAETPAPAPTTGAAPASSAAAPPATQPSVPPSTQAEVPTAQAAMTESFDPKLLVAGLVAAVAVLCLLLISARPES